MAHYGILRRFVDSIVRIGRKVSGVWIDPSESGVVGQGMKRTGETLRWIDSKDQLHALFSQGSAEVLVLKHSTQCPVSDRAYRQFASTAPTLEGVECWALDLLRHRDWSNWMAEHSGVVHESPQLLYLHNGICRSSLSHCEIEPLRIAQMLETPAETHP